MAMHNSISKLKKVEFISVDGNKFKTFKSTPHQTHVKGDSKFLNIAVINLKTKDSSHYPIAYG